MTRDLNEPKTRSACGAKCLIDCRDELETRAEVGAFDRFDNSPLNRVIDRHFSRVIINTMTRSEE